MVKQGITIGGSDGLTVWADQFLRVRAVQEVIGMGGKTLPLPTPAFEMPFSSLWSHYGEGAFPRGAKVLDVIGRGNILDAGVLQNIEKGLNEVWINVRTSAGVPQTYIEDATIFPSEELLAKLALVCTQEVT